MTRLEGGGGTAPSLSSSGIRTHGDLGGLGAPADDHTQYALLAGRGTGQTLIGGEASGRNLTLQSTSNANRGVIALIDHLQMGATGVGDEIQDSGGTARYTVATASPHNTLTGDVDIIGNVAIHAILSDSVSLNISAPSGAGATSSYTILGVNATITPDAGFGATYSAVTGNMNVSFGAGVDVFAVRGLVYQTTAQATGAGATVTSQIGVSSVVLATSVGAGVSLTVTEAVASSAGVSLLAIIGTITVTDVHFFRATGIVLSNALVTVTNIYGMRIEDISGSSFTNIFPISQEGTSGHNLFAAQSRFTLATAAVLMGADAAPAASAVLELQTVTGAFLASRMTTTQRDALTAVDGMVLYNSSLSQLMGRIAGAWVDLGQGAGGGGNHNIFSTTHPDTTGAASPVDGDTIVGNVTPRWSKLAIVIPAASVRNVLGIDNGELRPSWKTALDATNPANLAATAGPGTSLLFSHRDHIHAHLASQHEPGGALAMVVDAVAATGSLRTLGIGAQQAAVGSHSHAGGAHDTKGGSVSVTQGTVTSVTFATAFAAAPDVVLCVLSTTLSVEAAMCSNVTASGFDITLEKHAGGGNITRTVVWIATDAGDP